MDLPEWGTAKAEEGGKVVRVYDKNNVPIFRYKNPIVVNIDKNPFEIVSRDGVKIRETDNSSEQLSPNERIENADGVDEVSFEVVDNKLFFKLPETLKNKYPLKAYDDTDTSSVDNKDAKITTDGANDNFGSDTTFHVYTSNVGSPYYYRAVMDWTLSAGSGTISQISLFLYVTINAGDTYPIEVHELTQAFTEAGVTWNKYDGSNNWSTAGGDFSATIVDSTTMPAATNYQQWDLVGGDSDNPISGLTWESNFDLLLKLSTAGEAIGSGDEGGAYASKENASNNPYIEITYTADAGGGIISNENIIWFE